MIDNNKKTSLTGLFCGGSAFLIWGFVPLYYKTLSHVPAHEVIIHRIVWSLVFLIPIVFFQGQWRAFTAVFRSFEQLKWLLCTALLVSSNWFVFIWAIDNDMVIQASLGYYINPLISVLLGMLFLQERLRKLQSAAVFTAATGVFYLTYRYGSFPFVSFLLAITFGLYDGLMRKKLAINSAVGLAVETFVLMIPGIVYLFYLEKTGAAAFCHVNRVTDLLLIGTALVTAIPLLLFNIGVGRLKLATIGFLQYLGPSLMFLLAVFVFEEPLSVHQLVSFIFIWTALAIYALDSIRN